MLVIDVGGTHVKILVTGQKEHRIRLRAGADATADRAKNGRGLVCDAVTIGYPGPVLAIAPSPNRTTLPVAGSGSF
jgi:polyphosphate glucokinase